QPAGRRHEDAVDALVVHPPDRLVDVRVDVERLGRRDPERIEALAEELAAERRRRLRRVVAGEVRAAVVADVGAEQVLVATRRAAHRGPPAYSTVQVSPDASASARSPAPDRATAAEICCSMSWSWVGRGTARRMPTGTG